MLRIQDHVVKVSAEAAAEFFRYAKAFPADKLEWKPLDVGQSALSMCREIAMTPTWAVQVINEGPGSEEQGAAQYEMMATWMTVEECEAQFQSRFTAFTELASSMTEESLSKTKWLPYGGGRDHTFLEMLEYPRWNATYHTGQLAYIQILFGDKSMY